MSRLKEVGGLPVVRIEDYQESKAYNMSDGAVEKINLPVSNVLKYILGDGSWFCVRPSGT
ncbi:MAG: hypothetical protein ACOX27_06665 [Caldicoprobacterales bacterium]